MGKDVVSAKDEIKAEIERLAKSVNALHVELSALQASSTTDVLFLEFQSTYQSWYTPALRIVSRLAPDRLAEFKSCYEIDPKRKGFYSATYVIQDYMRGQMLRLEGDAETYSTLHIRLEGQRGILQSLSTRVGGVLANAEMGVVAEIQDAELRIAKQLAATSLRAAGAIAGVVLEDHLQRVAAFHDVKVKREPTINDLNEPLRLDGVYDKVVGRKIQYLADIRNLCSH